MTNFKIEHPDLYAQLDHDRNWEELHITEEDAKYVPVGTYLYWRKKCYCNACGEEHVWLATIDNRRRDPHRCPFCMPNPNKPHCVQKSLAFIKPNLAKCWHPYLNGNIKPSDVISGSEKKYWFLCPKKLKCGCKHEFCATPKDRKKDTIRCPVCRGLKICIHQSILYLRPDLMKEWDHVKNRENNIFSGSISLKSGIKVNRICKKGHKYDAIVSDRTRTDGKQTGCPYCRNKTESILFDWLKSYFTQYKITHQVKFEWCRSKEYNLYLPFDFCIEELLILVELDGAQHFRQFRKNWKSPEETQKNDKYKMELALKHGYSIIRLLQEDVYGNKNNWSSSLVEHTKKYKKPTIVYICENNEYDVYKKLMGEEENINILENE